MAEETFTVQKGLLSAPGHDEESKAWGAVARSNDLNADMIVRTEHDETNWVYVIDRDQAS